MLLPLPTLCQQAAPETPDALRQRLSLLYQQKKWDELADVFESLTPVQRGSYLASWLEILERSGRWDRLLQVCDAVLPQLDAVRQEEQILTLQKKRLTAFTKLDRRSEALTLCELLGDKGDPFYFVLGTDQARLTRDFVSMERLALKWAAKKPGDPLVPGVLGEALARQERFGEAEPQLQKAVTLNPKDADSWCNLGRCFNDRKAWQAAETVLNRALELDPKHLEARYNRGRTLFELKRYREAVDDFQAALALAPADATLAENLRQAQRYLAAETQGRASARAKEPPGGAIPGTRPSGNPRHTP
jgi:tetratricopeptide (TPR) repeat protein